VVKARIAAVLVALAMVFAVGAALGSGGSVMAATPLPSPSPSPSPSTSPAPDPNTGGPKYGTAGGCAIVSSSSYLGLSCAGSSTGGRTVKQILGDSDVPDCWNEPLTDAELAAMNVSNKPGPDGWTYYWEKCLKGVDPETKTVSPEGMSITLGLRAIDHGDPVKTLDQHQQELVNGLAGNRSVPVPIAGVSPADHPRVGGDVSFFDGTADQVEVPAGAVVLRAQVDSIDIEPLGPGRAPKISCDGTGLIAKAGDTPTTRPGACWYRYLHSSAHQPEDAYPVQITAHWSVGVSIDGGVTFAPFNSFTKSQITTVEVTEVQALVVG
jgi:hypothetical protein